MEHEIRPLCRPMANMSITTLPREASTSPYRPYDVQLNLTVPLLGASHGHTRKQAKIQGEVISTQVGDLRLQIDTELAQDLTKLEESGEIIEVQSANVKLATESLRVGELSYPERENDESGCRR